MLKKILALVIICWTVTLVHSQEVLSEWENPEINSEMQNQLMPLIYLIDLLQR